MSAIFFLLSFSSFLQLKSDRFARVRDAFGDDFFFAFKRSVFVKNICQCLIVTFNKLIKLLVGFLAQFRNCKIISKSVQIN